MIRLKIDFEGLEKVRSDIKDKAKKIESNSFNTVQQVADIGFEYALNLAPEYLGNLKSAMMKFEGNNESWVILSGQPGSDKVPINVWFDQGTYPNPRDPNSLFFMQKTVDFLREEFEKRLNLTIERSLR